MLCLAVLVGSCLAKFVPITAGFGTLVWRSAVMDRPRESGSEVFLNEVLLLFWYPRSALALLEGTLPLRYCAGRFASWVPTWPLPAGGHAADLVTGSEEVSIVRVEPRAPADMPCFNGGGGGIWKSGPRGSVKRVRLNTTTLAHLVRHGILGIQPRPRVWKRLRVQDHLCGDHADVKARRVHQDDEAYAPVQDRTGVGRGHLRHAQAHVSRLRTSFN